MAFHRQVVKFRDLQQVYQPGLGIISPSPNDNILDVSLSLPSSLLYNIRSKCSLRMITMEKELCIGQCHNALSSLRLNLHSRSQLLKDKYVNIWHQGPNTKSRELLNRVSAQISSATERYTTAHSVLNTLDTDPAAQW